MSIDEKVVSEERRFFSVSQINLLRRENNPRKDPVGRYKGRCGNCHGRDFSVNGNYSCNDCGQHFYF